MNYNLNALCYYQSALDLFLPAKLNSFLDGFELCLGDTNYFFCGVLTPFNPMTSATISQNKLATKIILFAHQIPTPQFIVINQNEYNQNQLSQLIASLHFPLVIKPIDRGLGAGVICNIKTIEKLKELLSIYLPVYSRLLIEEFHANLSSYRVLVFQKKIIGVLQIYPPSILGDGKHSVQELIERCNKARPVPNLFVNMGSIIVNEECLISLEEQNISLHDIPEKDRKIVLGYSGVGGTYKAISHKINRKNKKIMLNVAKKTGLTLAGIDVECEDIYKPIEESKGAIIETNHNPNVKMHECPQNGKPNRVSMKIMRTLIYRHPLAYFLLLIHNKTLSIYLRIIFIFGLLLLGLIKIM